MKLCWRAEFKAVSGWFGIAMLICWPIIFSLNGSLIGDASIDVWNHAWGYWYVFQQISSFQLPLQTDLLGAPSGGSLYYIDTLGAVASSPVQLLFGAAVAYNLTLLARVALAGYGAQLLAREIFGGGRHTWIAGIAYASTPFLLCELANGISEVCATQWLVLAFWATARATRTKHWKDFLLIGVFQGLCSNATFYYGLTSAIIISLWFFYVLLKQTMEKKTWPVKSLKGIGISLFSSIVVMIPFAGLFIYSLQAEDRLVIRDTSLNDQLLRHNAVDPLIYFTPGNYQSVDLAREYGEPFIHTGYLRWSVLLLCAIAIYRYSKTRLPAALGGVSLVLGLGSYLWWQGEWVLLPSGEFLSLPFDWMRQILPQIAITHPLRLSLAAQAIFCTLSAGGVYALSKKTTKPWQRRLIVPIIATIVLGESFFMSAARWPVPRSQTTISEAYAAADSKRNVLDLPAEAGTSMKTSRYFWNQTKHQRPVPYTPDARLGSTRDLTTFRSFIGPDGIHEDPKQPDSPTALHMRQIYGLIAVHPELDLELATSYRLAFTPVFGEPKEASDGVLYWKLPPLSSEEELDVTNREASTQPYSDQGEADKKLVDCDDLDRGLSAYFSGQDNLVTDIFKCDTMLSEHCALRLRNPKTSEAEVMLCLEAFDRFPTDGDLEALFQLLRRPETTIVEQAAGQLQRKDLSEKDASRLRRLLKP